MTKKLDWQKFSPDSKFVSYVYRNNIYTYSLDNGKTEKITHKGLPNKIICGATDWVYEEEFALVQGYQWSPNSKYIAYYIFDESKVEEFSMDILKANYILHRNVSSILKQGKKTLKFKSIFSILKQKKNIVANVNRKTEHYLPRIKWTNQTNQLFVQRLNRHQNHLELLSVNPTNGNAKLILKKKISTILIYMII